jgi:hypothetical protein
MKPRFKPELFVGLEFNEMCSASCCRYVCTGRRKRVSSIWRGMQCLNRPGVRFS